MKERVQRESVSSRVMVLIVTGLLEAVGVSVSNAATVNLRPPLIDAELESLMRVPARAGTKPIKVIAVFHDQLQMPARGARLARSVAQMHFMQNARVSQASALQELKRLRTAGTVRFKSLWLANAIIIETRARDLGSLVNLANLQALRANGRKQIIRPVSVRAVSPRALGRTEFTYGLQLLNIPQLREAEPGLNGQGVKVGILDTGIDEKHPDIFGKVEKWRDFLDGKWVPYDDNGHGTHVAGTIAGGNTSGTAIGVAPAAHLFIGKIFDSNGGGDDDTILQAMEWLADPDSNPKSNDGPSVVSNSWGGGKPDIDEDPANDVFCRVVDRWLSLGILPVFSAGNSGPRPASVGLPGGCPSALTVGATDSDDQLASFSSLGPARWKTGEFIKPEVSAPGVDVISAAPHGGYQSMSGTSMAAPHVAGLAALLAQLRPVLSPEQIALRIQRGSKDLGADGQDNEYGWGRIDAWRSTMGVRARAR